MLDERVRQFLATSAAAATPPVAPLGTIEAEEFLWSRRSARRATRSVEPVGDVLDLRTDTGVGVRVYIPSGVGRDHPLVLYIHGGGWVTGDLDMHDATCRSITRRASAVVVNVDYRLAPEHPFPLPLDDCTAAVAWAMTRAGDWGANAAATVIAGTSAGANLAAAVAIRRRDEGAAALRGVILLYPVLDATMSTASYREHAEGYLLTAAEMRFYWDAYVQDGADRTHPWLSPGLVDDLAGLPPMVVITAEHDPLRDEGNAFAERLEQASLLLTGAEMKGQIHGFLSLFPDSDAAQWVMARIADAIRQIAAK